MTKEVSAIPCNLKVSKALVPSRQLKQFPRVATRYDKLLADFMGFVKLAAITILAQIVKSSLQPLDAIMGRRLNRLSDPTESRFCPAPIHNHKDCRRSDFDQSECQRHDAYDHRSTNPELVQNEGCH